MSNAIRNLNLAFPYDRGKSFMKDTMGEIMGYFNEPSSLKYDIPRANMPSELHDITYKYGIEDRDIMRRRGQEYHDVGMEGLKRQNELMDMLMKKFSEPRTNPNLFLNALDHYIASRKRSNADYVFKGLFPTIGGWLKGKETPELPPGYTMRDTR